MRGLDSKTGEKLSWLFLHGITDNHAVFLGDGDSVLLQYKRFQLRLGEIGGYKTVGYILMINGRDVVFSVQRHERGAGRQRDHHHRLHRAAVFRNGLGAGLCCYPAVERNRQHVVGTPGSGFGPCGEGYFRLTAFNTYEKTAEALKRIGML